MTSPIERYLLHRTSRLRKTVKQLSKGRMKGVGGICLPTQTGWIIKSKYGIRRYTHCNRQEAYQRYQVDVLNQIHHAKCLLQKTD